LPFAYCWDKSEKTLDLGLVVADNSAELHFELASLMDKRGDLADARTEYQRTLVLDPQRRDAANRISSLAQSKATF
jgi:Flp pilus assembly protein TadD